MATIKISELQEVVSLSENDTLPITNQGETKQVAVSKLGDILATKEYVNKTISEQADMGFTPIIVDELPTYEIETNTIYMIPGEDGDGDNIYEEWMYINNKWEKVGSTGSGEISQSSTIYEININANVSPRSGYQDYNGRGQYSTFSLDVDALASVGEQFTKAYTEGYDLFSVNLLFKGTMSMRMVSFNTSGGTTPYEKMISAKPTSVNLYSNYIPHQTDSVDSFKMGFLDLTLSWTNNGVCTCSGSSGKIYYSIMPITIHNATSKLPTYGFITKTNTSAYEPTEEYNPATKKYVDDSIKTAIATALESDY